jgi:hypothetical protein
VKVHASALTQEAERTLLLFAEMGEMQADAGAA